MISLKQAVGFRWLYVGLAVVGLLISSLATVMHSQSAYAVTAEECYKQLNGITFKSTSSGRSGSSTFEPKDKEAIVNSCKKDLPDVCAFAGATTVDPNTAMATMTGTVLCKKPSALVQKESLDRLYNPIVTLICGSGPTGSEGAVFAKCAEEVRTKFSSCDTGTASDNLNPANPNTSAGNTQTIAECFKGKYSTPLKVFQIQEAIDKGRAAQAAYIAEETKNINLVDQKVICGQTPNGTWDDKTNKCNTGAASAEAKTSCAINGIGWLVCTVANFFASFIDGVFTVLSGTMKIPAISTDTKGPLYQAWDVMRNIANVAFVIAFMIVIYSQITGGGFTNYSIKKLLPRIIVAAVLVNISFWLCAILVDISNVAGNSIHDLLENIRKSRTTDVSWTSVVTLLLSGSAVGAAAGLAVFTTLSAASLTSILYLALPMLLGAAIAVVVAIITIMLRQAVVILLIIVSPLAFVAYLLPNTSQWFDKWRKLFTTMLVFYTLFAFIFGGSQLVAVVLMGITTSKGVDNMVGATLLVTALAVQVLPLFIAPWVMKASGGMIGNIASKIQGATGGLRKSTGEWAKGRREMSDARALANGPRTGFMSGASNMLRRNAQRNMYKKRSDTVRKATYDGAVNAQWEEYLAQGANMQPADPTKVTAAERKQMDAAAMYVMGRAQDQRAGQAKASQNRAYASAINSGTPVNADGQDLAGIAAGLGGATARSGIIAQAAQVELDDFAKNVKAIQDTIEFPDGQLSTIQKRLKTSIRDGDMATSRALQNILMQERGAPGLEAWEDTIKEIQGEAAAGTGPAMTAEMASNLKSNIRNNNPRVKSQSNASMEWALSEDPNASMASIQTSAGTWSKLTTGEFMTSKPFAQESAILEGAVSAAKAQEVLSNKDSKDISDKTKEYLRAIADGNLEQVREAIRTKRAEKANGNTMPNEGEQLNIPRENG